MTRSLAIVGAGRVGRALGRRLHESGWKIQTVSARSEAHAKKAVRFIGAGRAVAGIPGSFAGASTILLTVPDDAITVLAGELAATLWRELRGRVVLHTSGALDATALDCLRICGASVGSMHPLQSFNGVSVPPLSGRVFAVEGDELAARTARRMTRALGGVAVRIRAANKPLYHAGGAFAAGLALALEEAGVQMLVEAGLKRREAQRALLSLTREVLDNYEKLGPQKAWTGPLSRGDFGVVASHETALRRLAPEFGETYRAASRLAARVLARNPDGMLEELDAVSSSVLLSARCKGGHE
jgi:predicted short-subunit dehydrogenase-like oxidoreductase (DUF2520 family)